MSAPFQDFAESHLDIKSRSGVEVMFRCVVHDDSRASAQYNIESGLWVCFACGEGGSTRRLARELGVPYTGDPTPELEDVFNMLKELSVGSKRDGRPKVKDESFLRRFDLPTDYWKERGLTAKTVRLFKLGYDPLGELGEAVTIPVRDEQSRLLGVVKRYLGPDDDVPMRYHYPKGFSRSKNLFGSWLVEQADVDEVALVEGPLDAIRCWQAGVPALAVYGSSISPDQARLLRRLGVTGVVLFFDNDKAGKQAASSCIGLHRHKRHTVLNWRYTPETDLRRWFFIRRVKYIRGMGSDPGSCNSAAIRRAVRVARAMNYSG